ncbi:DDE-type integrase/transposase/recombinase [Scytonema sp. UIC 10036]|uniref:Mu transposase C-terminal domain-containing protein n=1 Tax=Scytonema sp. UIC 10036 TaxID=2304196 RepID=UPI0012DAC862|nr:Mu transposase C-terminal domain-containing protein [Scytonema sp. UIC 10036]MUG91776.1 DDE-type integrase/transposase/recombinase [Scytonema sp. UIC 10036]
MSRVIFKQGLHFWLDKREYVIQAKISDGNLKIIDVVTDKISFLSEKELVHYFVSGELEFESDSDLRDSKISQADLSQIPEHLKLEAFRKEKYVKAVIEQKIETYTSSSLMPIIKQVAQNISDSRPPSNITLYRWLKDYTRSGGDLRALIPRYQARGNYDSKIHSETLRLIDEVISEIYLTLERPSIARVYDILICRILHENHYRKSSGLVPLNIPHRSSIYRLIKTLDPIDKAVSRYGIRTANLIYEPVQEGFQATRPLERVEIDHTKLPFFVVDIETRIPIGTPSLTSAVDKYSGVIVGYYLSFEPFSYLSVMQCLLHSIQSKDYLKTTFNSVKNSWNVSGIMEILVVDNGKEFYSEHLHSACQQLGITIQYTPPKMPWYKSTVERTFGTYNTKLLTGQPGTLFQELSNQYDYDPQSNAVVSLSALQEMIHIFIVDVHNQSSHPQFKCPRSQVWTKGITEFPVRLPINNQDLKVLIGATDKRIISRRGIEFNGLYYNSPELARLRSNYEKEDLRRKTGKRQSEKATIKYDPTDLSKIYVFDPISHQFIVVSAVNQEYTQGLTIWQHRVIKNLAAIEADKVDIVALALAKQRIQEIVEKEWQKSHKGKTRKSMARWLGIGIDGFGVSDVSISTNESIDSNHDQSLETHQNFESLFNQTSSIMGISDLNNAIPVEQNPQANIYKNSQNQRESITNSNTNQPLSLKDKQHKKTVTNQSLEQLNSAAPINKTDDWSPDLLGWDASYGLPRGGG